MLVEKFSEDKVEKKNHNRCSLYWIDWGWGKKFLILKLKSDGTQTQRPLRLLQCNWRSDVLPKISRMTVEEIRYSRTNFRYSYLGRLHHPLHKLWEHLLTYWCSRENSVRWSVTKYHPSVKRVVTLGMCLETSREIMQCNLSFHYSSTLTSWSRTAMPSLVRAL